MSLYREIKRISRDLEHAWEPRYDGPTLAVKDGTKVDGTVWLPHYQRDGEGLWLPAPAVAVFETPAGFFPATLSESGQPHRLGGPRNYTTLEAAIRGGHLHGVLGHAVQAAEAPPANPRIFAPYLFAASGCVATLAWASGAPAAGAVTVGLAVLASHVARYVLDVWPWYVAARGLYGDAD